MKAVGVMQVAPVGPDATAERLARAWDHASYLVRRATVLAAATSLVVGATAPASLLTRAGVMATGVLFALAGLVDVYERRLPNRLLLTAFLLTLAATADGSTTLAHTLGGAMAAGGLLLAVRLARGIGMGDVKMAAVVGASVGGLSLGAVPVAIAIAAAVAAGVGLATRRTSLPFGPALWLGWAVALSATSMGWMT